jgi:hypothetical protein
VPTQGRLLNHNHYRYCYLFHCTKIVQKSPVWWAVKTDRSALRNQSNNVE